MAPDTSAPPVVIEIDENALRRWPLPLPHGDSDKNDRGRVLLVAGSHEIPGAAVLAATAALRAGAGRVTIATPQSIAQPVAFAVPESRVIALPEGNGGGVGPQARTALDALPKTVDALLVGPGLPGDPATCELAAALVERYRDAAVLLDAGAMRACIEEASGGTRIETPMLLTPHAGEMASLTGADKDAVLADPLGTALTAAKAWNAVVALKGATTWIAAPGGRAWRHEADNPGLAISGSGDVLAGIIAGLLARGASLEQAAAWGVALHARAGARLARRMGPLGFLARELPDEVPALMGALSQA